MAKPTYWELLKHPNWQRKRLEIMERAGFECEHCGNAQETLNIHHTYYEKGLNPWDYPNESLQCLCETCHKSAQDMMTALHRQIGRVGGAGNIATLYGFALAMDMHEFPNIVVEVASYEVADGIGKYWGLSADEVIGLLRERSVDGWAICNYGRKKNGLPPLDVD